MLLITTLIRPLTSLILSACMDAIGEANSWVRQLFFSSELCTQLVAITPFWLNLEANLFGNKELGQSNWKVRTWKEIRRVNKLLRIFLLTYQLSVCPFHDLIFVILARITAVDNLQQLNVMDPHSKKNLKISSAKKVFLTIPTINGNLVNGLFSALLECSTFVAPCITCWVS